MEVWKDIKDYEGLYKVSNLGRIKSLARKSVFHNRFKEVVREVPERIMNPYLAGSDYYYIKLKKDGKGKGKSVHRIVAETFMDNPTDKPQVNHIDGDKLNNRLDNLEWATQSENMKHSYDNNLRVSTKRHKEAVRRIGKKGKLVLHTTTGIFYDTAKEACQFTGTKFCNIHSKLNGSVNNNTNLIYA